MYAHLREAARRCYGKCRRLGARTPSEEHLKGMVLPDAVRGNGFNYIGPIDGHDVKALIATLSNVKKLRGAISTCRHAQGQGLRAGGGGSDQCMARGRSIRPAARFSKKSAQARRIRRSLGSGFATMADRDPSIIGITPAMREGSGLVEFSKRFPDRYFDVAIAEQQRLRSPRVLHAKVSSR